MGEWIGSLLLVVDKPGEVGCVAGDVGLDKDRGDDVFSAGKLSYGVYGLGQEGRGGVVLGDIVLGFLKGRMTS
ncbi:unnamed protein product [Sphenostylis stenocarpa]|uniref:Uncharacterized protein n=1 Tax=Sphenostylis stenocarpa TaxID=92480 RepID=A0AA86T8U7_9FABA|nr:unnamed protein product [Sphenostylis stenocarpa]